MNVIHRDNNELIVRADESGENNGHRYAIEFPKRANTPSVLLLFFQQRPVKEVGVNGLTTEALLAILIHRTTILNEKFNCKENKAAISSMHSAMAALESRTADRLIRGVEGKNES